MKWFDSNFDYVQELIDRWNSRRKKIRAIYFIIAAILIIAGILTAIFPVRIFIVIQYLAAAAIIIVGIYPLYRLFVNDLLFQGLYAAALRHIKRSHGRPYNDHASDADRPGDHLHVCLCAAVFRLPEAVALLKA